MKILTQFINGFSFRQLTLHFTCFVVGDYDEMTARYRWTWIQYLLLLCRMDISLFVTNASHLINVVSVVVLSCL